MRGCRRQSPLRCSDRWPKLPVSRFDGLHEVVGTNRLLQANDVGKFGRAGDEVERCHSGYGDDGQVRNTLAHHRDDVETVRSLQEDIDDRKIEAGILELPKSRIAARGFNYLEMMDP